MRKEENQLMKNAKDLDVIIAPLLQWYQQNKRDLPWRHSKNPYSIWVSEIMLQQTRVDTVIGYYQRFLTALPTVQDLAQASEEQLLKLWEGLGYYSRVRNMQKAAQVVVNSYQGVFPTHYVDVMGLPGIGEYTAGAICSIAFEQPTAAVDGNVLRVITRLTENYTDITRLSLKREITQSLEQLYPRIAQKGDFTQALMELGATVCLPNGAPKCDQCPLLFCCQCGQKELWRQLPVKSKKIKKSIQSKTIFLLYTRDGQIALEKRPNTGVLSGMWGLIQEDGFYTLEETLLWLKEHQINATDVYAAPKEKHIFTHLQWDMQVYHILCPQPSSGFNWFGFFEIEKDLSLPTAFKKVFKKFKEMQDVENKEK